MLEHVGTWIRHKKRVAAARKVRTSYIMGRCTDWQDMMQRLKLVLEKEAAPCAWCWNQRFVDDTMMTPLNWIPSPFQSPIPVFQEVSRRDFWGNTYLISGVPISSLDHSSGCPWVWLARYDQSGLEALIFAAEGDMRNALNGAQLGTQGDDQLSGHRVVANRAAEKRGPHWCRNVNSSSVWVLQFCWVLQFGFYNSTILQMLRGVNFSTVPITGLMRIHFWSVRWPIHPRWWVI